MTGPFLIPPRYISRIVVVCIDTLFTKDRYLYQRIAKHFEPLPPQELSATSRTYPLRQQADLQRAVDELLGERIIPKNFVGIHQQYRHDEQCFSKLLERGHNALEAAPAQYEEVAIADGETARCLKNGLWLPEDQRGPYAVVLTQKNDFHGGGDLVIEVAAPPGQVGAELCTYIFDALEQRLSKGSCYRRRVLSLEQPYMSSGHSARISVHTLEPVSRDDVILRDLASDGGSEHARGNRQAVVARAQALGRPS